MTIPREAAERIGHWFKALAKDKESCAWCDDHGIDYKQRAASEGINSAGGFLVPQDFDTVPVDIMPTVGAFRRGTNVQPTTSDYQVTPRLTGSLTAYYAPEGTAITESYVVLGSIDAYPKRIATLTKISSELMEDSPVSIANWLVPEIRWALDSLEDDWAWNATGISTYGNTTGLFTALTGNLSAVSAQSGHDTYEEIDSVDLGRLIAGVEPSALSGAAWYVNSAAFGLTLSRLSVAFGGIMMRDNPDGTMTPIFMGWPIYLSAKLPDVGTTLNGKLMIAFGDLKKSSILVERQPTTVSLSWQRYMDTDSIAVRASRRIAIVHHSIGSATVKAPIAMLIGA